MPDNYNQSTVTPYLPISREGMAIIRELEDTTSRPVPIPKKLQKLIPEDWLEQAGVPDADSGEVFLREDIDFALAEMTFQKGSDGLVYVYFETGTSDESCSILQWLLQNHIPKEVAYITIEGASTCSKMRQGEFGGFACFITRDDVAWYSTGRWLGEQEAAFSSKGKIDTNVDRIIREVQHQEGWTDGTLLDVLKDFLDDQKGPALAQALDQYLESRTAGYIGDGPEE